MKEINEQLVIDNLNKYIELIDKNYCMDCNELNTITGDSWNGSYNVKTCIQDLLQLYNQTKHNLEEEKHKNELIKTSKLITVGRRTGKTLYHKLVLQEYVNRQCIEDLLKLNNIDDIHSKIKQILVR